MEIQRLIDNFLKIENGSGYGSGDGSGYGDGYGYGSGDGSGDGDGYGSGSGSGYGSGSGDGLKSLDNQTIHQIDGLQTIISSVRDNVAKGYIVNSDLTITPCFVVKGNNYFAHGKTLKEAMKALQDKIFNNLSIEERIDRFIYKFPNIKEKIKAVDLFEWHNRLTGSCKIGREQFCKDKGINVNSDSFTILEFIKLTENNYGREVILTLKEKLGINKEK